MKGIVFTIDAVFAIMVATIAISILIYFNYSPVNQYNIKVTSLSSLENMLSTTPLENFSSPLADQMNNQYQAGNQAWTEFYQNDTGANSNMNGPYTDSLLAVYNATGNFNANGIVAAEGNIYVLNCSCGGSPYSHGYLNHYGSAPPGTPGYYIYYDNMFIAANNNGITNGQWTFKLPASSVLSSPILGYDSMIIVPVYTNGNSAETGIMGLYADNGTEAWVMNTAGAVNSIAIANGEMAVEVGNTISVLGYQGQGAPISLYNTTYPYSPTRIVFYKGLFYVADSASIAGIAVYNDTLFSQSVSNYTSSTGNVNSGSWTVYMPPYVGVALSGGQPVASNGSLYTLWSNGYLIDQNTNNGKIMWMVHIPYSGTISPRMILAYGELFVVVGNKLISFGSCPGISGTSVLSNMASLYLTGLSSCADNLLNTANPSQNASVMVNSYGSLGFPTAQIYPYALNFTAHDNYVSIPSENSLSPEAGPNGRMSLCVWYDVHSLSDYYGPLVKGENPPSNGNAWEYTLDQGGYNGPSPYPSFAVSTPSGQYIAYGAANTVTFNSIVNNWSFSCFTYDYPGQKAYYYFNGVQYTAYITDAYGPAYPGTGNLIIGAGVNESSSKSDDSVNSNSNPGYSNVSVADLQIYNIILSPGQIKTLYDQGITASPIQYDGLVGWWPFGGDANDYSGNGHTGFPFNVTGAYTDFISPGYLNSQDISVSKSIVIDEIGGFQLNGTYVAGVYSWK